MSRASALSPAQMWRLDTECAHISEAFGATPYLVGSVLEGREWRDVDVRLILPDDEFEALDDMLRIFIGLVVSEWLSAKTGLPIDFQIQQMTGANLHHPKMRNPLGSRNLMNFGGDWDSAKAVLDWEVNADGVQIADGGLTTYEIHHGVDFLAEVHLREEAPTEVVAHELAHVVLRHREGRGPAVPQHGQAHQLLTMRILQAIEEEP